MKQAPRGKPRGACLFNAESALVGGAFGDKDEVHAAVVFLRARGGFTGASGNTRGVNALFAEILLGEFGAFGGELGVLGFLWIRKAHDYDLGIGIVLEAQGHVVADALAEVIEARRAGLGVTAIADLGGLWRRRRLLHVHVGRSIGVATPAIADRALHGVASWLQTGGIKLHMRSAADDLATGGGVAVAQRIAIGIAGRGGNGGALARHNRAAVGGAGNRGRLIGLGLDGDVRGAGGRAAFAVVDFGIDGVGADAHARRGPARVGAGAVDGAARGGVGIGKRIVIRIAGVHVDLHAGARAGKDRGGVRRAGRDRRMVRRRRRLGETEAQHYAGTDAQVVLASGGTHGDAVKIGAQIVDLGEAPSDILPEHDVQTATGRKSEAILRATGNRTTAVSEAHEEFAERNKVIKLAPVQPGTEQHGVDATVDGRGVRQSRIGGGDGRQIAMERVACALADDTEPLIGVVNHFTRPAKAIEIGKRVFG